MTTSSNEQVAGRVHAAVSNAMGAALQGDAASALISMGDVTLWVIRSPQEQVKLAIGAVKQMGSSNRRG